MPKPFKRIEGKVWWICNNDYCPIKIDKLFKRKGVCPECGNPFIRYVHYEK